MESTNVANSAPAIRHDHAPALPVVWQSRWGLPIGYAVSSEALALELLSRGVALMYRPTPWHIPGVIRHPALRAAAARTPRDDALQVGYDQADLFFTEHPGYKIGYTILEVDGLPREWVTACNAMDEIWTTGRRGATVFADAGVTRPIVVIPLGYDPARFRPDGPACRITGAPVAPGGVARAGQHHAGADQRRLRSDLEHDRRWRRDVQHQRELCPRWHVWSSKGGGVLRWRLHAHRRFLERHNQMTSVSSAGGQVRTPDWAG